MEYFVLIPISGMGKETLYGDLRFGDAAKGFVLRAQDGAFWKVSIDNAGNLKSTKMIISLNREIQRSEKLVKGWLNSINKKKESFTYILLIINNK